MLQQNLPEESTPASVPLSLPLSVDTRHAEAPVEDYLDHACAALIGKVPYAKRKELREEMRANLHTLIAAHQELGSTSEEAVQLALQQAAGVATVTQNRKQTHTGLQSLSALIPPASRPATFLALGLFGLPYLADVTKLSGQWWSTISANDILYYRIALFLVPLIAGLATGLMARRRAARGVLNALILLTFPAILWPGFVAALTITGVLSPNNPILKWVPSSAADVGLPCWLMLGCGAASVGGRLRQLGVRLRSRQAAQ